MVKREYLEEALQEISDEHLAEAACVKDAGAKVSGKRRKLWKPIVALVTAAAVLTVVVLSGGEWWNAGNTARKNRALTAHAIGEAVYPEMSPYPDESKYIGVTGNFNDKSFSEVYDAWREDQKAQRNQPQGYTVGADRFAELTIPQFLSGAGEENVVYSPLNAYMALAMAAELTDGEAREQILKLLGADTIETLRWKASAVWNAHYSADTATTSVLASSLWLDEGISYNQSVIDVLADTYYASSYQGDLQSDEMGKLMKAWLSEQTGGLLDKYVDEITMDPETVIALATTIYFREKWMDKFSTAKTETGVFHSSVGDVECDFMYQKNGQNYYWAEKFGATYKSLENGEKMWFILPDEGVSVDEVLADPELIEFLEAGYSWENSKTVQVHLYLPKFDISSSLDLTEGLMELGVTDIFNAGEADFSPISEELADGCFSQVEHAVRVAVDEDGVTAAAYTMMMYAGAAMPPDDEVEFKLDRPFIFAVTAWDGLPLFVGVVNQP